MAESMNGHPFACMGFACQLSANICGASPQLSAVDIAVWSEVMLEFTVSIHSHHCPLPQATAMVAGWCWHCRSWCWYQIGLCTSDRAWAHLASAPGATCQVQPQLPWVLWTLLHDPRIWAALLVAASTAYAAPLVSFPNYTGGYICWCWSAYQGYPCLAQGCQGTCFESQQVILALPYNPVMSLN